MFDDFWKAVQVHPLSLNHYMHEDIDEKVNFPSDIVGELRCEQPESLCNCNYS